MFCWIFINLFQVYFLTRVLTVSCVVGVARAQGVAPSSSVKQEGHQQNYVTLWLCVTLSAPPPSFTTGSLFKAHNPCFKDQYKSNPRPLIKVEQTPSPLEVFQKYIFPYCFVLIHKDFAISNQLSALEFLSKMYTCNNEFCLHTMNKYYVPNSFLYIIAYYRYLKS